MPHRLATLSFDTGAGGAAGAWASPGGYLRSGPVVRMDYLPRAREGELRFVGNFARRAWLLSNL